MGWLASIPETTTKQGKVRWKTNRLAMIEKMDEPTGLSDTPLVGGYMLDHLIRIGGTKIMPNVGEVSLDWEDIWFYHKATQSLPHREERIILKGLSDSYAVGKYEGLSPLSIAPANRDKEE